MATIKNIAEMTGFSVGTVSAVINGKNTVNFNTRKSILKAIQTLNYTPNSAARSLVTKKYNSVGIVLFSPETMDSITNPLFLDIIKQLAIGLNEHYKILIYTVCQHSMKRRLFNIVNSGGNDALILLNSRDSDLELFGILNKVSIPVMTLNRNPISTNIFSVGIDNYEASKQATQFLLSNGHQRIAFVGQKTHHAMARMRLNGYYDTLKKNNIAIIPELVYEANYDKESGEVAARNMLKAAQRGMELPTAVFAANDLMALGVLDIFLQNAIKVPEQISVMGMGNMFCGHLFCVSLATVDFANDKVGTLAARKLMGVLNKNDTLSNHIPVDFSIVPRASVKKLSIKKQI